MPAGRHALATLLCILTCAGSPALAHDDRCGAVTTPCTDVDRQLQQVTQGNTHASFRDSAEAEQVLRNFVLERFARAGLHADIQRLSWQGRLPAHGSDWRLRLRPAALSVGRRISLLADWHAPGREARPVSVLLVVRAEITGLLANRRIARHSALDCTAFQAGRIDIATLHKPTVMQSCPADMPLALRHTLEPGDPLSPATLAEPFAVNEQAAVRIRVASGRIVLESGGTALASAHIGEWVLVRPSHATQTVKARVVASGLVVLEDGGS